MFENKKDYNNFKKEMYDDLRNVININVCKLEEYDIVLQIMMEFDLFGVYDCVRGHLWRCTKNEKWSDEIAHDLSHGAESMLMAVIKRYEVDKEKMKDMLYEYVTYRLDDGKWPCILVPWVQPHTLNL